LKLNVKILRQDDVLIKNISNKEMHLTDLVMTRHLSSTWFYVELCCRH